MKDFDETKEIAIIWSIDDVLGLDDSLTDEQAFEVLKRFENHHEGSMEQMWWDLEYHLDEYKSSPDENIPISRLDKEATK